MTNINYSVGDTVLIVSATIDGLIHVYGSSGDNDFWIRDEWDEQQRYVGCVGTIIQLDKTPDSGTYALVQFKDEKSFTFDVNDLAETLKVNLTAPRPIDKLRRAMTAEEARIAEALLISMFAGVTDLSNAQSHEAISIAGMTAIRFVDAIDSKTVWHITDILNEDT